RRQRALPGHRAIGERAGRGQSAVHDDGLPEPHPLHLRAPGNHAASLFAAHPLSGAESARGAAAVTANVVVIHVRRRVRVHDLMQQDYSYALIEPPGRNFAPDFHPELTPKEMLRVGVFGGKYMTDCRAEFPASWFTRAKLCHERHDPALNFFGVNASKPLSVWRRKGWLS